MAYLWGKLGKKLRDYRESGNLGLRETARDVGMSPSTLSRIERGRRCTVEQLLTITGFWTIDPMEFWKP